MLTPSLPASWRGAAALKRVLLHPYTLFTLASLVVFLLDGFNIGPANDAWRDLGATSPELHLQVRLLGNVPRVLGMQITPGGFQGWELMLLLLTIARGILFFETFRLLFPRYFALCVACGLVAIFQPTDYVYFWMDSIGVDFAFAAAFACCLASLVYLQTGRRSALFALFLFQFISCLSYTAFLPLIFVFPLGAWILRRVEGRGGSAAYLLKVSLPMVLFIGYQARLTYRRGDREGKILDLDLNRILLGYAHETSLLWKRLFDFFVNLHWDYVGYAMLPAALAFFIGMTRVPRPEGPGEDTGRTWKFYLVLYLGLVALAFFSYLPYSLSIVRIGDQRQMAAAGTFVYVMLLIPLFMFAAKRPASKIWTGVLLGVVALFVICAGFVIRRPFVDNYRRQEVFLRALTQLLPAPPRDSFIVVHLNTGPQAKGLSGLYNRRINFPQALRFIYGDRSITGEFTEPQQEPFGFDAQGIFIKQAIKWNKVTHADYAHLILVDYRKDGTMAFLDRSWLQKLAPPGIVVPAFPSGPFGSTPSQTAIMCTMLEDDMRPSYCQGASQPQPTSRVQSTTPSTIKPAPSP